ncbi:MAG: LysM peptidoglycan-binding domain-containing protein [Ignavibacteria bacterium]|nr:LysM peptidoglycan-binding domain-containing protein [Ignavibacteria bacterium]
MKIELQDSSEEVNIKSSEHPFDHFYTGKIQEPGDFKIFIKQETLGSIDDYLASDINNELGGVLIGNFCINKEGEKFISISDHIIAKHTNSSISRLTFTHETWEYINEKLEQDFPGKIILGWFHSHPGHTVFLSNYDIFIQENFFNLEYMVAYVFDPTIRERGFFYKRDNEIIKSNGHYLYEIINGRYNEFNDNMDKDNHIESENVIPDLNTVSKDISFIQKVKNFMNPLLLILNIILLSVLIYNYFDLKQKIILKDDLNRELNEVKNENLKFKERLDNFIVESELKKVGLSSDVKDEKNKTLKSQNTEISENKSSDDKSGQNENLKDDTKEPLNNNSAAESVKYKVKPGDTLEKISFLFYKSREGIAQIMQKNDIKNKADIKIGQVLEIPEVNE